MGSVNKGSGVCDIGLNDVVCSGYGLIDVGSDDLLVDEACVQDEFQIICNINVGVETGKMVCVNPELPILSSRDIDSMVRENYLARLGTRNKLAGYEAEILLKSEGSVFCTPRRLSFAEKREVSLVADELLERGVSWC